MNGFTGLFDTLDRKAKLYQSKSNVGNAQLRSIATFIPPRLESRITRRPAEEIHIEEGKFQLHELTKKMLLQYYAPASVLVNEKGDIINLHGRTGMYLESAPGEASMNILKMVCEGLSRKLITALHKVVVDKKPSFYLGLQVKTNGDFTTVNLVLLPLDTSFYAAEEPYLVLVIFEEPPKSEQKQTVKAVVSGAKEEADEGEMEIDACILALELELQTKEEDVKAFKEELET